MECGYHSDVNFGLPLLNAPRVYSLTCIRPIQGCATEQGMVFVLFVPKGYIILHESVLNWAYNFI